AQGLTAQATPGRLALVQELAAVVGARREREEVAAALEALQTLEAADKAPWQMAGLNGLADGMGRRGTQLSVFLQALPEARRPVAEQANRLLARAGGLATDTNRPLAERRAAVALLAHAPWKIAEPVLASLLNESPVQE